MYAYMNHIRVVNVEKHLTTCDSGIVATFEQTHVSRPNVQRLVIARLKYVGWVEEILELNYEVLKTIVLLCNWVKTNYNESSATIKRDKYNFTFIKLCFLPIDYNNKMMFSQSHLGLLNFKH
jgi:hypothetical protein